MPTSDAGKRRKRGRLLTWITDVMVPAAEIHTARRLIAVTVLATATTGFRIVAPIDEPALIFRYACMAMGVAAAFWLIVLMFFPPKAAIPPDPPPTTPPSRPAHGS